MSIDTDDLGRFEGLSIVLERVLRPAVGFQHPSDVLKDPELSTEEKRAVLSSWASDACAVDSHPALRLMVGCEHPVLLDDILDALGSLDAEVAQPQRLRSQVH
jgi:hypothetical protein